VGAFGACSAALRAVPGMIDALDQRVRRDGAPFLGICVGMQLMADVGEEMGEHDGLGWIKGRIRRLLPSDPTAKVPHMGWNDVRLTAPHPLIEAGEAYFLHSYAFEGDDVVATTDHAGSVVAAIARDNMAGVQFHPEKSQRYGLELLKRFLTWRP
jgi:glutamine amidotransferase